ncbi:GNAT family N-acetyltransferase [Barrientosiimonas marina]|uniref:GNAT family N-acetyltransferase n=1 Tax=Lentibacillus kimchii TaxID=1542911 RepID=A0ABW2UQI5_9BACI
MTIRKANQRELEEIMAYALHVLQEASMGHIPPTDEKAFQMVEPFLKQGGYYLVYAEQDVLMGWIAVGSTIDHYQDKPAGMIPELYVLSHYRGQGIAEDLCRAALAHLQEADFDTVMLNVFAGNSIKSLYEELGFQEVSSLLSLRLK